MTIKQFLKLQVGTVVMNNQGLKMTVHYSNTTTGQRLLIDPLGHWTIWIPEEANLLNFIPRELPPVPETPTIPGYELDRYAGSGDLNSPDLYSLRFDGKHVTETPFKNRALEWQNGYITAKGPLYAKVEE